MPEPLLVTVVNHNTKGVYLQWLTSFAIGDLVETKHLYEMSPRVFGYGWEKEGFTVHVR